MEITMFTYKILATESFSNESTKIIPGDELYCIDPTDMGNEQFLFETAFEALTQGQNILHGMDGSRALNAACNTANIVAIEV